MPSSPYAQGASFVTGAIAAADDGWLVMTLDDLVRQDIANSETCRFAAGRVNPVQPLPFRTRFAALMGGTDLFAVGEYGQCAQVSPGGQVRNEQISVDDETPEDRGPLRWGLALDERLVVVGMDRQVYLRETDGRWRRMEDGLPDPGADVTGFEHVCTAADGELLTVGWEGEIWLFGQGRWRAVDSPTNRLLTCACTLANGESFAGGRSGMLLRGRRDRWLVVDDSGCREDLVGLVAVGDELFASSLRTLYRWNGRKLEPLDPQPAGSFAIFVQRGETTWSIGAKAVCAYRGSGWDQVA